MRLRAALSVAVLATLLGGAQTQAAPGDPDCDGPPPAAAPGTPEWDQREADNVFCGNQRSADAASNPS